MPNEELYYVVSREDKEAFLVRLFTYTQSVRKIWGRTTLFSFGVAGISAIYAYFDTHSALTAIGVFFTLSVCLLAFFYLLKWDWRRHSAQAYMAQFPQAFPSPHRVVLTEDGLSVSWGKDQYTFALQGSMKIHRADGWTDFVIHSDCSGIGIPDAAFKSETDRAEFVGIVETRLQAIRSKV